MTFMQRCFFLGMGILIPFAVLADARQQNEQPQATPWSGSLALGYVANTGNTRTTNANGQARLDYNKNAWYNTLNFSGQWNTDNGQATAANYGIDGELNYFYRDKHYVFGRAGFRQDQFSPYDYTLTGAAGLGSRLYESRNFTIDVQAGPGLMRSHESNTTNTLNQIILYAATQLKWNINSKTSISELLSTEAGKTNTYIKNAVSLNTALVGRLGLQLSFISEYNTFIPPGSNNTKKLDTRTNIALVYSFGGESKKNEYKVF